MLRQARLNSAYADRYPSLDPEVWYTAAAVAGLVKATAIVRDGPDTEFRQRLLSPTHFTFRGGEDERGRRRGTHSRRTDRQFAPDRNRHQRGLLQAV